MGTPIGEFNATDPDAGATLTYHLVSGAGDGNNSLFTLDTNGTLKTATIFDYESNASTYSIRVQVRDEFNATMEGNFTVSLMDIYEPSLPNHLVDLNSTVNLEMIWVEPGTFSMGSPLTEPGRSSDETEHNVTLTKGFYLGKYEVTQAQYEAIMAGNTDGLSATPSNSLGNPNRPVEMVNWYDVQIFLNRLNAQQSPNIPVGWAYVLPSESQWEYACRAGTTTAYSWGATISCSNANYSSCGYSKTRVVGMYGANPWGFSDMHGNVYEWTADWYDASYPTGNPEIDPTGSASGSSRVRRGGSWTHGGSGVRSARRGRSVPSTRIRYNGFRVGFQQITTSPSNLVSTAALTIAENQPAGTIVGEFNAADPDANATLSYHLVSGAGDGNNSLFTLDSNGTLRTATIFDFESNASTYSIRVQVKDEFNATTKGNFTVTLVDLLEDMDGDGIEDSFDPDDDNDGFSDVDEIAYGSDPLDPNSLPNRAPSKISLSPNRVEENMPIGTMVGQLRTIDFDDPNGTGVYQYLLLSGGQDDGVFTVDQNGTLQTRVVLDFERASFHTVVLRVTDNLGAHLDQNLNIQVVDTFAPIVETGDPVDVGFQEAILSGKLLDKGSSMDLIQIGMLVSTDPNPYLDTTGVIRERGFLDTNQTFEVMMMGLEKGTKYFYRTYAMNTEGIGYGVVKDFVMQEHARGPSWANAQPGAAANWWTSPWFGSFYMNEANASWIMHSEMGWLYPMESPKSGVWLWKENLGWLWTNEEFYPFLYQNTSASWLYFYGSSQDRLLFYHYREERWLQKIRQKMN